MRWIERGAAGCGVTGSGLGVLSGVGVAAVSAFGYPSSPSVALNRLAVTIQHVAQHLPGVGVVLDRDPVLFGDRVAISARIVFDCLTPIENSIPRPSSALNTL
jgi:hypothetical protein